MEFDDFPEASMMLCWLEETFGNQVDRVFACIIRFDSTNAE